MDNIPGREDGDFIEGIYNWCDRWCERCRKTTQCRQYAIECTRDAFNADGSNDGDNADFVESLIFTAGEFESCDSEEETSEFGYGDLDPGSDPTDPDFDEIEMDVYLAEREQIEKAAGETECVKIADQYLAAGTCWLDEWDILIEKISETNTDVYEAEEIIRWDLFQLPVKLRRAVSGLIEADVDFIDDVHGSAKVALLGADRSLLAWRIIHDALPRDQQASVDPMISHLENLIRATESEIPGAREFKRPGFDD